MPRLFGGRPLRAGDARVALSRPRSCRIRRRAANVGGGLRHPPWPARGAGPPRRGQPGPSVAGGARGCSPRRPEAPSRKSPTIASCSIPTTPSLARSTRTSRSRAMLATSSSSATRRGHPAGYGRRRPRGRCQGAPPTIPFWLGEAPARSDELSRAVSDLRSEVDRRLDDPAADTVAWLMAETGLARVAADQAVSYLAEGRRALGVIPSQDSLVLERFFDEAGGMQLVLHAPFGSRINKAWGLALRKRFCRQFNFELQAAATEDALMLSLGPQHSFPLSDVFRYLHPETTRDVLVQAFLDAPVFKTRWRWNTTISLAVPRSRGGRKVAPQIQRMQADDLMAAVFPDAAACLENIPGIGRSPITRSSHRPCGTASKRRWISKGSCRARPDPPRRAAADCARHAGAVALRARDPQRPALCLSRRCATRGTSQSRGAVPAGDRSLVGGRCSAPSTPMPSRGCARRSVQTRGTPTSCTTRC